MIEQFIKGACDELGIDERCLSHKSQELLKQAYTQVATQPPQKKRSYWPWLAAGATAGLGLGAYALSRQAPSTPTPPASDLLTGGQMFQDEHTPLIGATIRNHFPLYNQLTDLGRPPSLADQAKNYFQAMGKKQDLSPVARTFASDPDVAARVPTFSNVLGVDPRSLKPLTDKLVQEAPRSDFLDQLTDYPARAYRAAMDDPRDLSPLNRQYLGGLNAVSSAGGGLWGWGAEGGLIARGLSHAARSGTLLSRIGRFINPLNVSKTGLGTAARNVGVNVGAMSLRPATAAYVNKQLPASADAEHWLMTGRHSPSGIAGQVGVGLMGGQTERLEQFNSTLRAHSLADAFASAHRAGSTSSPEAKTKLQQFVQSLAQTKDPKNDVGILNSVVASKYPHLHKDYSDLMEKLFRDSVQNTN